MDFLAKNTALEKLNTQCAVVFALGSNLTESASAVDKALGGVLSKTIKSKDLDESAGSSAWFSVASDNTALKCDRVLLVQLGKADKSRSHSIKSKTWNKAMTSAFASISRSQAKDASLLLDDLSLSDTDLEALAKFAAVAACKAIYRYTTTKEDVKTPALAKVTLIAKDVAALKKGLSVGSALGVGINTTRELGNLPGNICTPKYLANLAKRFAEECEHLSTKILNEKNMEKLGMGSLLSVSRGSEEEAKLIVMEYSNGKSGDAPHVLVGKGITFDTGGISIKPGPAMDEMKFDMCGAASVFGAMKTLMEMGAKVNVVAIVAAAENMPSGKATKPGDVVTSMSGQTIEVLNTDAEGRLVLCDALTYAERFKPKTVVDVATLTGACVIALGNHASGLYSNNEKLAKTLIECGEKSLDRAWHMPLWDEYQKQLDSNFADIANIGGREAGSITAACFLSRFTKKYAWAHLDIAGTAWSSGAKKGATGRPVSLLVEYVLNH